MARKIEDKKNTKATTTAATSTASTAPGATGGWYAKGDAGFDRKHQLDKFAALRREKGVPRFYLKHTPGNREDGQKDNEARIVFLDSVGFFVREHNIEIDGKYGNHVTCVSDFAPCEVCTQNGNKPIYTCYFTVIDTRKFVRKDGTVSARRRVLFPAKGSAIDVIENLKKRHGDLRGLVVDVKRVGDRDPNCGRDFEVVLTKDRKAGRVDPAKKFPEKDESKPYDYMKVLAPPTVEELNAMGIVASAVVGSDEDVTEEVSTSTAKKGNGKKTTDDEMDGLLA